MNALAKLLDQERHRVESENKLIVTQDPWRLKYHLMPPVGWLNDPNGLCQYQGEYHVFFQYCPYTVDGSGVKLWGHYSSKDLLNWVYRGTPLLADSPWDCHGVYSGSAYIENDHAYLYYTGNVKFPGDYDYINKGRGAATIRVELNPDGTIGQKQKVLDTDDYPEDYSCHIRDPKIWRQDDSYFMVLGARTKDGHGRVLQYQSKDLENWTLLQEIGSLSDFGYMWECPDIFQLAEDDASAIVTPQTHVLSFSPQGLTRDKEHFQNVYQSGYILLDSEKVYLTEEKPYLLDTDTFSEWDYGFDFYAPQTFTDQNGRQLLIAWIGLPDIEDEYQNPTTEHGWQHALSIPRVLTLKSGKIYQEPIPELKNLRQIQRRFEQKGSELFTVLDTRAYELSLSEIRSDRGRLKMGDDLEFTWQAGLCTLQFLNQTGAGRSKRLCRVDKLSSLRLMADHSLLELYLNDGEKVMTTRYYPQQIVHTLKIEGTDLANLWGLA